MKMDDVRAARNGRDTSAALDIVSVADIRARPVEWLWRDYLARGKLTLLGGDPSAGKSLLSLDIAATISKEGSRWPSGALSPTGSALILSAEDGNADTIRPRLEAADAQLDKILIVNATVKGDGARRTFSLQHDLELLAKKAEELGDCLLVIMDPVTSYMGEKLDSHMTTAVRSVMEPVSDFAELSNLAVLAITHPPKATQAKAINAFTGSLAYIAAARVAFIVSEEPETDRRLLLPVKNNIGKLASGRGYYIVPTTIECGIEAPRILWDDAPVDVTASQAMADVAAACRPERPVDKAEEFLQEFLADGEKPQTEAEEAARKKGITPRTLRRARQALKVKPEKSGLSGSVDVAAPVKMADFPKVASSALKKKWPPFGSISLFKVIFAKGANGLARISQRWPLISKGGHFFKGAG